MQLARRVSPPTPAASTREAGDASFRFLEGHLRRLRALPVHGNRKLCYHHLFVGLLLSFFDPAVRSLRLVEGCGDFAGRLDIDRLARSTTSDALAAFDPRHLLPVIEDLNRRADLLRADGNDDPLKAIAWKVIAGDGTYLTTLASVAWALKHRRRDGSVQGQVRLNVQMDVRRWTPQVVTVSGSGEGEDGEGLDGSEPDAFAKDLLSDVLYVFDRNFVDFSFLSALLAQYSHFVLRVKGGEKQRAPAVKVLRTLDLTAEDVEAGVVSDQVVELTGAGAPAGEFRLVVIHATDRKGELEVIRLLTDLTDRDLVSAKLVGEVYRRRWQIELFFKWLKTWAGLDHLWSTSRRGITFQFYVAVIGVLLLYVGTGRKVSRYAIAFLHRVLHGQMTVEQMMSALEKLEREKARARERAAKKRAAKKLA